MHVGVKVGGYHEASLDIGQVLEISSGCPGNDSNALGAESDNFFGLNRTLSHCAPKNFSLIYSPGICFMINIKIDLHMYVFYFTSGAVRQCIRGKMSTAARDLVSLLNATCDLISLLNAARVP